MKKTSLRILCILLCVVFLMPFAACSGDERQEKTFFLMDTTITVTLYANPKNAESIFDACRTLLSKYENLWSRTKEESDVGRFNTTQETLEMDPRTTDLIAQAIEVAQKTSGAFDITIAPVVTLWQTSEERGILPTTDEMQAALALVGAQNITLLGNELSKTNKDVQIDLGGIGKGAAISALIDYLKTCDIRGGIVSFGSNVAVFGEKPDGKPYRIAVKNPKTDAQYAGVLHLQAGQVLSVSGDYERYYTIGYEKYHHIIDPKTGYPAESGLCSVAVVCSDGALADALSTALFVMGKEKALAFYENQIYEFEAIFIDQNGNVTTTKGLVDIFEIQN